MLLSESVNGMQELRNLTTKASKMLGLIFKVSKCKYIVENLSHPSTITVKNKVLEEVKSYVHLGVLLKGTIWNFAQTWNIVLEKPQKLLELP